MTAVNFGFGGFGEVLFLFCFVLFFDRGKCWFGFSQIHKDPPASASASASQLLRGVTHYAKLAFLADSIS